MSKSILSKIPSPFQLKKVMEKYPVMYEESMNTVLVQEVIRYNKLIQTIIQSLNDLLKALKGLVVMSQQLEEMSISLFNNTVPKVWADKAYPSLKPLGAWVDDLVERVKFIQGWITDGIPLVFWFSGFFFPQAFLTGTLQNYARRTKISIDVISFDFQVIKTPYTEVTEKSEGGCYIRGLYIEGARWSYGAHELTESRPKELYTEVPVILLMPMANRGTPDKGVYDCPLYKTLTRAGTLSTTGHSTNFVVSIELPTSMPQYHWIKRGVAMLCALNY
ncbi:Dynein heavy chain 1, axonemal [Oopsacas minuta]|uniref:Dynein heavy chain 1, axonemal n=1 Tax=Oopsacas minuta TaxID=111878 RepID=A0AAV7K214_9METZ|nr:Dynein heavy chain 1, axonemal [Oopsacas minuta]